MHYFIALILIAASSAEHLGYNYQPAAHAVPGLAHGSGVISGHSSGNGHIHSSSHNSHLGLHGNHAILHGSHGELHGSHGSLHSSQGNLHHSHVSSHVGHSSAHDINSLSDSTSGSSLVGSVALPPAAAAAPAPGLAAASPSLVAAAPLRNELAKEFYTFNAPDEDLDVAQSAPQIENLARKNLRVIFIRAPEVRGLENAAIKLARHSSDQKTVIYVLNKQVDLSGLANKVNVEHTVNYQQPEVHFVKYRTPEDAANAQRQIQAQYDALGGSSQSHNAGVANVLNFASQAEPSHVHSHNHATHQTLPVPAQTYLPASLRRQLRL